jgi:ribosome-associated heat shock protein Hsp15
MTTDEGDSVRADKWLWAARFYKTRSLAVRAINGGKVHVNGVRIKPARRLAAGDCLSVQKGPYRFIVTVERLARQRRPAPEARELYSESGPSRQAREALSTQLRLQGHTVSAVYIAEARGEPRAGDDAGRLGACRT